jgi:hypothetical protein
MGFERFGVNQVKGAGKFAHPMQRPLEEFQSSIWPIFAQPEISTAEMQQGAKKFAAIIGCFSPGEFKMFMGVIKVTLVESLQPFYDMKWKIIHHRNPVIYWVDYSTQNLVSEFVCRVCAEGEIDVYNFHSRIACAIIFY